MTAKAVALLALLGLALGSGCTSGPDAPVDRPGPQQTMPGTTPTSTPTPGAERGPVFDSSAPLAPLRGRVLTWPTGLRLVIPEQQDPVVLDVDRRSTVRIGGLPLGHWVDYPIRVADTLVLTADCDGCLPATYVLTKGSTTARRIADGSAVAAALGGRGIWLRTERAGRCALGVIGLDGRRRTPTRPVRCDLRPTAETSLGLVAAGPEEGGSLVTSVIVRTSDFRTVFRGPYIIAVLGDKVLTHGPAGYGDPLRLTDVRTGAVRKIPLPQSPGDVSDGFVSPDGRWIAVRFANPAWPGPRQLLDVWLLDTRTLRWHRMPSMPVPLSLKQTGLAWTADGRFVLLGRFDRHADTAIDETFDALAVWRPGEPELAVRTMTLPSQAGGAGFIAW